MHLLSLKWMWWNSQSVDNNYQPDEEHAVCIIDTVLAKRNTQIIYASVSAIETNTFQMECGKLQQIRESESLTWYQVNRQQNIQTNMWFLWFLMLRIEFSLELKNRFGQQHNSLTQSFWKPWWFLATILVPNAQVLNYKYEIFSSEYPKNAFNSNFSFMCL